MTAAPSEFGTWAKLAEIYVGLEQWDLALLTLNSCPMFTYQDKDAPRMPESARVVLPVMPESMLDELDDSQQQYDVDLVHHSLRKLHAASYKGTFLKAYSLLTEVTAKIGWDQLLRVRSQVFVMEEEYRSEKQIGSNQKPPTNRNASTTALRGTPSPGVNGQAADTQVNGTEKDDDDDETLSPLTEQDPNETNTPQLASGSSIEKPEHTITSEVVKAGNDDVSIPLFSERNLPTLSIENSLPLPTLRTPNFIIKGSASAGSTTFSWCCTKICASIRSGAPRSPSNLPTRPSSRSRPRSGKFSASSPSACTISPRRSRPTSRVSGSGSRPRR